MAEAGGIPVAMPDGRIVQMTPEQYSQHTAGMGQLPTLSPGYVFGRTIPRPKTDAAGHIPVGPSAAAPLAPAQSRPAAAPAASPRAQTVQFWMAKGAPQHVAEGIADRVNAESGFRPTVPGDNGTSIGLYQHHADRKARLQALPNWQDPLVQHGFAYSEVTGGDAIATKHWQEILAAPDRATAAKLWDRYFERSAGGPGAAGGGGAGGGSSRRMAGRLGGMGPRVFDVPTDAPAQSRLGQAARAPAPAAQPQPERVQPEPAAAPVPAVAAPTFRASPVMPVALPRAPNLGTGYQEALASILGGQRRPLGSIFG